MFVCACVCVRACACARLNYSCSVRQRTKSTKIKTTPFLVILILESRVLFYLHYSLQRVKIWIIADQGMFVTHAACVHRQIFRLLDFRVFFAFLWRQ